MLTANARATDPTNLVKFFGEANDLLELWIAEPYLDLAPSIAVALQERVSKGWYGYEVRPDATLAAFWDWMELRHNWKGSSLQSVVSPSVGTSIAILIEQQTEVGSAVVIQPPVYTSFKSIIRSTGRAVARSPLRYDPEHGYQMDFENLESILSQPTTQMMILCNPHNPVGRAWTHAELKCVAELCSKHNVFVVSDEIHADIMIPPARFVPFAEVGSDCDVRWAAAHGPIKTFGLAGICDTLVIAEDVSIANSFRSVSAKYHLSRNNVFGLVAFETAYRTGADWLDQLLDLLKDNLTVLRDGLPSNIHLMESECTYLAWIDFRDLDLDAKELAAWLVTSAQLALSPGHWFGREGAGFARMSIATPTAIIEEAVQRIQSATQI